MPYTRLAQSILLPELTLISHRRESYHRDGRGLDVLELEKQRPACEICPKCACPATSYYDKRVCVIKDDPLRNSQVQLIIHKHRWWCKMCRRPFTEPVPGILPGRKTTQRLRKSILLACENYCDLSRVREKFQCSSALVYKILYEQLDLRWREYQYDWPKRVGIDEHFFRRYRGHSQFATVFTDLRNSRVKELCHGKSGNQLREQLSTHPGRLGVEVVCIDLSQG
jgi:transposase